MAISFLDYVRQSDLAKPLGLPEFLGGCGTRDIRAFALCGLVGGVVGHKLFSLAP